MLLCPLDIASPWYSSHLYSGFPPFSEPLSQTSFLGFTVPLTAHNHVLLTSLESPFLTPDLLLGKVSEQHFQCWHIHYSRAFQTSDPYTQLPVRFFYLRCSRGTSPSPQICSSTCWFSQRVPHLFTYPDEKPGIHSMHLFTHQPFTEYLLGSLT